MHALSFTPELAEKVRESTCNFVVTGASGWLGKATLEMLFLALGNSFSSRVTALGSRRSECLVDERQTYVIYPLSEWRPITRQPLIVFHYAFLTKDKVEALNAWEYIARNNIITEVVKGWIAEGLVQGVILPSSGAVYDHLQSLTRDKAAGLYGELKYQDELTFTSACQAAGCGLIIARVFNLSGPHINKFQSYALASFIVQTLETSSININARYPVLRSYYFIGDLVELCVRLLISQTTPGTECFDVAGDEVVELGSLAQRVLNTLLGTDALPVRRMPLLDNAIEDRYVGQRSRIQELEFSLGIKTQSLDHQITATSAYIKRILQL